MTEGEIRCPLCGSAATSRPQPSGPSVTYDRDEWFASALAVLDNIAEEHHKSPDVIGFIVPGDKRRFEQAWDCESRSPIRWRSGEWRLWSGTEFETVRYPVRHEWERIL